MKILFIDNYDSFTYNLVHYFGGFDVSVDVFRNDEIPFSELQQYQKIVLSPGPGLPVEAGSLMELIDKTIDQFPMLGVCLGFQAIIEHYHGKLYNQNEVKHGVAINCQFNVDSRLFKNLPDQFPVGLYHSWAADRATFPDDLEITATSVENTIMAFEHRSKPVCGVQFHPESILTEHGRDIVENFICSFHR